MPLQDQLQGSVFESQALISKSKREVVRAFGDNLIINNLHWIARVTDIPNTQIGALIGAEVLKVKISSPQPADRNIPIGCLMPA